MVDINQKNTWHKQSAGQVCKLLKVNSQTGLTSKDAQKRLEQFGLNEITSTADRGLLRLLFTQFSDVMILVLIAAAVISGIVGEFTDAVVILIIIVINAVIGFVQDYRAEKALAALRKIAASNARVLRDGQFVNIKAEELVPGDMVFLEAGNIIPADLRLTQAPGLQVNEAALTGESHAVDKNCNIVDGDAHALGDRLNMAFKGCIVTKGRGNGVCVATGMKSEFGKIASLLQGGKDIKTPLQQRLSRFGKRLSLVILLICALVFVIGLMQGMEPSLMFLVAVSLAVAAIPEALPAVITVSLALGAKRMIKSNALIRRLPAVEALGSVTYICSDKTGTLTKNSMLMKAVYADNKFYDSLQSENEIFQEIGKALALNNDLQINHEGEPMGDPTEIALFNAAQKIGCKRDLLEKSNPRVDEIAFTSERKCMSTIHTDNDNFVAYIKGAPEEVINRCSFMLTSDGTVPLPKEELKQAVEKMAGNGFRVIALAKRNFKQTPDLQNVEYELEFLSLLALIDPPREEAKDAVAMCKSAGIKPVMITGDHPSTALAIAKQLGIATKKDKVVTGLELNDFSDEQLKSDVLKTYVYARVNPEQKIRIVEALQSHDQFVAMTGDGVNDAPAINRANVGIAMGKIGTEVAREASHLVLLDDNFNTIVTAVKEGRRIFDNIRKFIKYIMTGNTGEILTLLIASLLGMPLPLLPIHILWINLVTDGLPGIALSVEPAEKTIMKRPPRPFNESMFSHGMWQHMLCIGLLIAVLSLLSLAWAQAQGSANWQTMVFTTLTFAQLVHVLAIRTGDESLFSSGILSNQFLLLTVFATVFLQLCVIYVPILQPIFKTNALNSMELGVCVLLSITVFFAVEVEKYLIRKELIYQNKVKI